MNFKMTKIAALAAMAFATTGAHAALDMSGLATLSIQNDAVTGFTTGGSGNYTVVSDGALVDSFFTMGGNKGKLAIDTQYAYIDGVANVINLNGSIESSVGTFTYYGAPGSNDSGPTGGFSVISASGDTASINMSNWKVDWNGVLDIPMGNLAWSTGYTSGVGNLTCTAGSGCATGSDYTLKYTATVPAGDASGFGGVKYYVELHGQVGAVPEASTYGMMLAGLGLVGFAVRRRKSVI